MTRLNRAGPMLFLNTERQRWKSESFGKRSRPAGHDSRMLTRGSIFPHRPARSGTTFVLDRHSAKLTVQIAVGYHLRLGLSALLRFAVPRCIRRMNRNG